jgi:predicted AAA+ superfamily ATPase
MEIFDRLYNDWSALVKFQRTRGVLRLMAAVIHSLWEKGDRTPLILPSTIPIDDQRVQFELTRYLSDNWVPVLERDVDGPNSYRFASTAKYRISAVQEPEILTRAMVDGIQLLTWSKDSFGDEIVL